MLGRTLSGAEKEAIAGILDVAESEYTGTHSPYESMRLLDDHCTQLFPGWTKSHVTSPTPPSPLRYTRTSQSSELLPGSPPPKLEEMRDDVYQDLEGLKGSLQSLMSKIKETASPLKPDPSAQRDSLRDGSPAGAHRKRQVTEKLITAMEKEVRKLTIEGAGLQRHLNRLKRQLYESQEAIVDLRRQILRSESIRRKMAAPKL
jgi:hypothetical protein